MQRSRQGFPYFAYNALIAIYSIEYDGTVSLIASMSCAVT